MMMRLPFFAQIFMGVLLGATGLQAADDPSTSTKVTVQVSKTSPMPAVLKAGVFTFKPTPPDYAMQQWLTEMRPGVVEIDIGGPVFQMAEDAEDALVRVRRLLPMLKRIQAAGAEPVLAISRIPVWLSSKPQALDPVEGDVVPKASVMAPRNSQEWTELVSKVVAELKSGLGRTPDIKVGWEPDQSAWQGSETDFFNFYRDTVRGVKKADPTARVGGPSVSALFNGKGGENMAAMLPRFLQYCATTPAPELGWKRLPVDFVVWHQFGTDAVLSWNLASSQVRTWLQEAGYPANTPTLIGEWSSWLAWPSPESAEQDRPALAAYIVASLAAMEKAGIDRAAFTSLMEQREVEGQAFIGSFGLFTNQFIKKPSYWAFHAIGKLGSTRLEARSNNPLVSVIAGKPNAKEIGMVIATSVPGDKALLRSLVAKLLSTGLTLEQIKRDMDVRQLERLLSGDVTVESIKATPHLKQALSTALQDLLPLSQAARTARNAPRSVQLELPQVDLSKYRIELWRIDSTHANAVEHTSRINSYVLQRLQQEKQTLPQGLLRRMQEKGYKDEHIEWFKQTMGARNRESALAARPTTERRIVRSMADEAQGYIHDRMGAIGQEVNAWPELAFKATNTLTANGNTLEFDMEADSVVYVRMVPN